MSLSVHRVSVRYPGQAQPALSEVTLDIGPDDLTVALGPSGCGKTTLLNLFAGFVQPSGGAVSFDGKPVRRPGADRAVVFQHDALLPWLNVRDNVAFGLRLQGAAKPDRRARADEVLRQVDLAEAGDRQVWQLSGGQKQRVGIARALASPSRALLLDEPFGALDAFTREQMQELLLKVWRQSGRRIFLITHDIEEALFLATELVLMSPGPGRIVERLRLPFSRRYRDGEPARSIKSDPVFIELREQLLAALFAQRLPEGSAA
ncbi:taurine ABC transporter ATP-binding subunit [Chromobacterium sphagni]|uniref:Taurine transporter ATP-binding subunit n=1 Tax=Chromobacterium sphagni TaxID=1903179 RepID=A0A1S1WXD6_9NEIS|nr:taurine ABC transporter ATP-binding subunit [Chromobacterium sphagni]OHX11583.1 taurine transporter ATP-binding subunit [Chromobacterium sphagni]OHX20667.1 taurine transporter ATP-binding subunit [Chromobacterium sphagni]